MASCTILFGPLLRNLQKYRVDVSCREKYKTYIGYTRNKLRVVGLGPSGQWLGSLGCFWTRPSSLLKSTFGDRLWCFFNGSHWYGHRAISQVKCMASHQQPKAPVDWKSISPRSLRRIDLSLSLAVKSFLILQSSHRVRGSAPGRSC
jgi:hypothetical protein